MHPIIARLLLCCAFGVYACANAQPLPAGEASPTLVDHLVSQLEKREQPATGMFGIATAPLSYLESEQQLRRLGARASAAAPRVAELLARTERNGYELGWTLWSVSADSAVTDLPALTTALADARGADRLVALARLGRTKSPLALPALQEAGVSADAPVRLLAAIALGFQKDMASGNLAVDTLAALLKDKERAVRQAALNGLRLQGPRAVVATPALIEHLRARDNVFMTAEVLAFAPTRDLLPLKPELEALLTDTKLTEYQKRPVVELLLRIENEASKPAAAPATPVIRLPAGREV